MLTQEQKGKSSTLKLTKNNVSYSKLMNAKVNICIVTIYFLFLPNTFSQVIDYTKVKDHVDSVSIKKTPESFETLAKELVKPKWEEVYKAYAIYYWIASNIAYDSIGYEKKTWENYPGDSKIAFDTYDFKKGVCAGYSFLYKFMCEAIGLEVKVIDGYARTDFQETGLPIKISNHTWNAVKIDNKWRLIDVTWARAISLNKEINDYYFLTSPEEFIVNHFPENEENQFIKSTISKLDFDNYPYFSSKYFELGFNKNFPKNGLLIASKNRSELIFNNPPDLLLLLRIYDYKLKKWIPQDYNEADLKDKTVFTIKFKHKGEYLLVIDAMNQNFVSIGTYKGLLAFRIIIN
jgi:transglutaminase/protease-like cytokinesis protein 3